MGLPKELMITVTDLDGSYGDCLDCPLARALKRASIPVNAKEYAVSAFGRIVNLYMECEGQYEWEDGTQFNSGTLKTGRLVLK